MAELPDLVPPRTRGVGNFDMLELVSVHVVLLTTLLLLTLLLRCADGFCKVLEFDAIGFGLSLSGEGPPSCARERVGFIWGKLTFEVKGGDPLGEGGFESC